MQFFKLRMIFFFLNVSIAACTHVRSCVSIIWVQLWVFYDIQSFVTMWYIVLDCNNSCRRWFNCLVVYYLSPLSELMSFTKVCHRTLAGCCCCPHRSLLAIGFLGFVDWLYCLLCSLVCLDGQYQCFLFFHNSCNFCI